MRAGDERRRGEMRDKAERCAVVIQCNERHPPRALRVLEPALDVATGLSAPGPVPNPTKTPSVLHYYSSHIDKASSVRLGVASHLGHAGRTLQQQPQLEMRQDGASTPLANMSAREGLNDLDDKYAFSFPLANNSRR